MITILTPTYNRAYTLNRLYNSLCNQKNKRFDWIIVDDGSTDNTANLVDGMQNDKKISIHYHYQPNSGKHVAINEGVKLSNNRDWILIVDSDDALTEDAIDVSINTINQYATHNVLGVGFRRAYFKNSAIIGNTDIAADDMILSATQAANLFKGDIVYIFKREALLNNPFPVIAGEKFVPELFIWNKITDQGDVIFFPKKYIYYSEYLADGYSQNFQYNLEKNPQGFKLFYQDQLSREQSLKNKLKCCIRSWQCNRYIAKNKKKGLDEK